ncbi:hypothetical protein Lesp01_49870 [Lentzea sp. NBRC 102530]|nr:hypothetical protein Lesp01_49870 [Lentzea sp. NBRC 102530]
MDLSAVGHVPGRRSSSEPGTPGHSLHPEPETHLVGPSVNDLCICGWPLLIVLVEAHVGFVVFLLIPTNGRTAKKIGRWGRQHGPERGGRTVADLIEDRERDNVSLGN